MNKRLQSELEDEGQFEGEITLKDHCMEHYPDILIKMTKEQFSIFELKRRHEHSGTLKMNPDFQRDDLWDDKQKCELIESILMGIPIPIIYLFEDEQGCKQVVDGRQRLSCIFDFLNRKFKLKELNILKAENNKFFNELTSQFQAKIEDYQFLAYTIQHPTPEKVKFDIFDRVNRGGTRLNNQEMRNALYLGVVTDLLNTLAKSQEFLLATEKSIASKRMKDKYIILRFLGFFLLRTGRLGDVEYKSDIDEFLAEVMKKVNRFNDAEVEELANVFRLAMKNCYLVLGEGAFRFESNGKKRPINMGLFECLGYMLSVKLPENTDLVKLKERIVELKREMGNTKMFMGMIDSKTGIDYRFNESEKIRIELINYD